jgi:hypothetical protein
MHILVHEKSDIFNTRNANSLQDQLHVLACVTHISVTDGRTDRLTDRTDGHTDRTDGMEKRLDLLSSSVKHVEIMVDEEK